MREFVNAIGVACIIACLCLLLGLLLGATA